MTIYALIPPPENVFCKAAKCFPKLANHDCMIGYYDHGKIDGHSILLMEYVEGANLKLMYGDHDPVLARATWRNIIIDMAIGLGARA